MRIDLANALGRRAAARLAAVTGGDPVTARRLALAGQARRTPGRAAAQAAAFLVATHPRLGRLVPGGLRARGVSALLGASFAAPADLLELLGASPQGGSPCRGLLTP
ncbi:MAG TPA: hypothetical protein VIL49_05185 [Capillimicrobium sp.]